MVALGAGGERERDWRGSVEDTCFDSIDFFRVSHSFSLSFSPFLFSPSPIPSSQQPSHSHDAYGPLGKAVTFVCAAAALL